MKRIIPIIIVAALGFAASGCATLSSLNAIDTGTAVSAANFHYVKSVVGQSTSVYILGLAGGDDAGKALAHLKESADFRGDVMMTSVFKIAEVKHLMKEDPTYVVITPGFDEQVELIVSGIPADRVKVLLSIMATNANAFVIMQESQYKYYKAQEDSILSAAERGGTVGQNGDS